MNKLRAMELAREADDEARSFFWGTQLPTAIDLPGMPEPKQDEENPAHAARPRTYEPRGQSLVRMLVTRSLPPLMLFLWVLKSGHGSAGTSSVCPTSCGRLSQGPLCSAIK